METFTQPKITGYRQRDTPLGLGYSEDLQAHGAPLWVNALALADAMRDPTRHTPCAHLERQAIDDLCILMAADKATAEGQIIKRLQDTLKARNDEIRTLRQLYCAVSAASEMLERHEPPDPAC